MPWTARSGKSYMLCLLDTNAVSEILKQPKVVGRGFVERFGPSEYVPCFTIYNFIELRRKKTLFDKFAEFFSVYPCFLLKPYQMILEEERLCGGDISAISPLMNAFTPAGPNSSYDLRAFVDGLFLQEELAKIEKNWRNEELVILQTWLKQKDNFEPKRLVVNAEDADAYVFEAGLQTLMRTDMVWAKKEIDARRVPDIDAFPSVKMSLYSQYYRLYDSDWKPKPQEVTDVMIMAAAPYMDAVVTERFQAEIMKKVRKKVVGLETLEILKIRDIRYKENN